MEKDELVKELYADGRQVIKDLTGSDDTYDYSNSNFLRKHKLCLEFGQKKWCCPLSIMAHEPSYLRWVIMKKNHMIPNNLRSLISRLSPTFKALERLEDQNESFARRKQVKLHNIKYGNPKPKRRGRFL